MCRNRVNFCCKIVCIICLACLAFAALALSGCDSLGEKVEDEADVALLEETVEAEPGEIVDANADTDVASADSDVASTDSDGKVEDESASSSSLAQALRTGAEKFGEDYLSLHFDVLNVDLPLPKWVAEWNEPTVYQRTGTADFASADGEYVAVSAFLTGDGLSPETGEPEVYDDYFFDDVGPDNVIDWSDKDGFFKIHAVNSGFDTFMCVYHLPEYTISCKMTCKSENVARYEEAFDFVGEAIKKAEAVPQTISDEDITKHLQRIYPSPRAEVDHYEDGYKKVFHMYDIMENPDESHTVTYGWVIVDPITGEAIDMITYERFVIPGAKVNFD